MTQSPHPVAFLCTTALPLRRTTLPILRHPTCRSRPKRARRCQISNKSATPSASPLPAPPISSTTAALRQRRYLVFLGMGLSYAMYVGLRSTFPFAAPTLGLSLQQVGAVSSAFPITYGLSRLITGALVDNGSPRLVLLGGLSLAGLSVALMSLVPASALPLALLWALHGLVQGAGAGSSAKLLTSWFAPSERGRWWALWATSANAGAFAAPLAVSGIAATLGARAALFVSGGAAIVVAALALPAIRDTPASTGHIVPWASRDTQKQDSGDARSGLRKYVDALIRGVLCNRALWALALANASIYLVRSGLKNWLHFFLIATRDITPATAALRASVAELGGVAGTFGAGVISDMAGGRRVPVTVIYLLVLALSLLALGAAPVNSTILDAALIALVGFAVNGPQMMIGLIGAEIVDSRVLATAAGLLGFISYAGAAAAGYPLSAVVASAGWTPFFAILSIAAVVAAALLVPFWKTGRADGS